ncbi:uncharacterized protein BYT42DRAFT_506352 [Radiomyces spectabilis]|uniref:uncharacterized protein n=1 Tax=Radiomyces spectabilis TaxID=64574 RepID=UPI00221E75A0|nr:uncharacterized protein BYT42DRAFT_506352 [Radiomyces spectabilis]KAI8364368.1 hypothetical protein BYT42DRAFT_506352 [Radiomyces spectabilis]
MFIVDGHEQASALHPLICRFNQTVHVMVTGVNRGLSGTVLEKTFRQTKCGAIVHDMQLQATDDLTMSAAVIDSVSRLMLVLRPRILIYLQDDRPLTRALEVMAHDQQVVAIGLPSKDIRHALWIADLSLDALQYWHKMNIKLVVITDRRPHSLSRLLQSTGRSYYLGDKVDLMVHMEQSADRATRMLINSFQWRHGSKIVRHRIRKGGLMPAIIESWYPDHDDDYAVLLEDDIEVSPLFYAWAKYSVLQYRYSGDAEASRLMYGVSLYSPRNLELWPQGRRPFHPRQALQDYYPSRMPYLSQVPCSWGAVYFPEHWREFHHYLTVRLEDMQQDRLLNITVPDTRSERWKKSWKKYFIQLMYLRSYVMLYPNFQQFESFSTNHLEFGTHVKKERRQKTIGHFQVPLMQRDTILAQLPDHRLPYFNDLPVLDLWGRLVTHTELDRIAAAWHRRVSACERNVGHFDAQDLLCPFPKSDEEREAMSALAMLPSTKKPKEGPKTKEAMQPIAYTTIYLTPPTGKEAALEDEPVLWSQEDDLPQPIDVSRMSGGGQEEVRTFLDEELQDIHQDIDSLNRLFYSVYSAN